MKSNPSEMGGLGHHFGGPGHHFGSRWAHFGAVLVIWAGSGYQVRLRNRFGRLLNDFKGQDGFNLKPKLAPSWSQSDEKIDAKID